jgi:hypothetical protein
MGGVRAIADMGPGKAALDAVTVWAEVAAEAAGVGLASGRVWAEVRWERLGAPPAMAVENAAKAAVSTGKNPATNLLVIFGSAAGVAAASPP